MASIIPPIYGSSVYVRAHTSVLVYMHVHTYTHSLPASLSMLWVFVEVRTT